MDARAVLESRLTATESLARALAEVREALLGLGQLARERGEAGRGRRSIGGVLAGALRRTGQGFTDAAEQTAELHRALPLRRMRALLAAEPRKLSGRRLAALYVALPRPD